MVNVPKLELVGKDGNAFSILARAQVAAKKAGWEPEAIALFLQEAQSGDYNHLLATCMKYFRVG